jgi:hypothetical protein
MAAERLSQEVEDLPVVCEHVDALVFEFISTIHQSIKQPLSRYIISVRTIFEGSRKNLSLDTLDSSSVQVHGKRGVG